MLLDECAAAQVEIKITDDTGNPLFGVTNHSGGIVNPFVSESGTLGADTHPSHPKAQQAQQLLEASAHTAQVKREEEDKSKKAASAPASLSAVSAANEKTTSSDWPSVKSIHDEEEMAPKALILGVGVTVVAGVVNLFVRSMGILGLFFSFPLWSRIDPIPVMLLANQEIKRRKEQAEKEEALENKGGHLGQVLDD